MREKCRTAFPLLAFFNRVCYIIISNYREKDMKLKYDFVMNEVAGSTVAVPVGNGSESFKGYVKLNDTGAYIFGMLKKDVSREEIIDGIMKDFEDCTKEKAEETVDRFLRELKAANILC